MNTDNMSFLAEHKINPNNEYSLIRNKFKFEKNNND